MTGHTITLTTSDGVDIEVERQVAERSILIKNLLEDLGADSGEAIPIPNFNEQVMRKVIEWCEQHKKDPPASTDDDSDSRKKSTDIDEWDQKFMQVDQEMLFEIILGANYLDIKALLDVCCKTVANMIKGKSPDEIRKTFNIQNDWVCSLPGDLHIMILELLESDLDLMKFSNISERLNCLLASDIYKRSRLIQFLYHAKRRLTIGEAVEILAVDPSRTPAFDPRRQMGHPESFLKLFPNIIAVHSNEVHLAHIMKDCLANGPLSSPDRRRSLECQAHVSITEVCLAYLEGITGYDLEELGDACEYVGNWIEDRYPFAEYCAKYWMDHARVAEKSNGDIREKIVRFFLPEGEEPYFNCLCVFDHDEQPQDEVYGDSRAYYHLPPLYLASLKGLRCAVERLVDRDVDINEFHRGTTYAYALGAACRGHDIEIIRFLLGRGADVNPAGGGSRNTPLMAAISEYLALLGGLRRAVRHLIHGDDINRFCRGTSDAYPLVEACRGFDVGILRDILEDEDTLALEDTFEILSLLLDNGADVNPPGEGSKSTLLEPVMSENFRQAFKNFKEPVENLKKAVELLLEHNANPNTLGILIPSDRYGEKWETYPLNVAAANGMTWLAKMLLDNGADPNNRCDVTETALIAALARDHMEFVKMLLDQEAVPRDLDFFCLFLEHFRGDSKQARRYLEMFLGVEMMLDWDDARFQDLVAILVRRHIGEGIGWEVCMELIVCLFTNVPAYSKVGNYPLRPPWFLARDAQRPLWYPNSKHDRDLRVNFEAFYSDPRHIDRGIRHPGPKFAKALTRAVRAAFMQLESAEGTFVRPEPRQTEDQDLEPIVETGEQRLVALKEMHAWLAAFNPSQADVRQVLVDLQRIPLDSGKTLPAELALSIVSTGYRPRVIQRSLLESKYSADNFLMPAFDARVAGLYLRTERVPSADSSLGFDRVIPQRIVFHVTARDQGWVSAGDGTYGEWRAFFEASILRPTGGEHAVPEEALVGAWKTPEQARGALKERGWDILRKGNKGLSWRVCNMIKAGERYGRYRVEWRRGRTEVGDESRMGRGEGFLELLQPGDVVVLWARAVDQCWEINVRAATIEIEYEVR